MKDEPFIDKPFIAAVICFFAGILVYITEDSTLVVRNIGYIVGIIAAIIATMVIIHELLARWRGGK